MKLLETEQEICLQGVYHSSQLMSLEAELDTCLQGLNQPKDLNLARLEGSDSGLIALLLSFQRFANQKQWQVSLINASEGVKGLVELSQLDGFFSLVEKEIP